MNDNEIQNLGVLTSKEKIVNYYNNNKLLIYTSLFALLIIIFSIIFYLEIKEKKREALANNYIDAKIYLANDNKNKAEEVLRAIIFENDKTYSTLSLFLVLNEKLIKDPQELIILFDHVLENNKFDKEIKNLIIFKKGLFESNYADEQKLLNSMNSLINSDSFWKPHALLMLGDFFVFKKEYLKAQQFYTQILSLKNINKEFYTEARSQLIFIQNEK